MVRSSPRIRLQLRLWLLASVMAGGLVVSRDASALTLGQSDGFEDGTTQGWVVNLLGSGSPPAATLPTNVATGGPGGANDNYLQLTSNGTGGSGGRLVSINVSQWAGNYTALGVTGDEQPGVTAIQPMLEETPDFLQRPWHLVEIEIAGEEPGQVIKVLERGGMDRHGGLLLDTRVGERARGHPKSYATACRSSFEKQIVYIFQI